MKETVGEGEQIKKKRDNYARKLRRKKLINYLRNELQTCTTHGLPYIVNTEIHYFERLFWFVSFTLCLGIVCTLITSQYTRYINAPFVNTVEMDYFNWNVSFPAITVCPKIIINEEYLESYINKMQFSANETLKEDIRTIASISLATIKKYNFTSESTFEKIFKAREYADIVSALFAKFPHDSLTTNTNGAVSVQNSMTEMGMCHVINSNVAVFDDPMKWNTKLKFDKTNIELSFYDRNFFLLITDYAEEYQVFIHNPNEIILATSPVYTIKGTGFAYFMVKVWSRRVSGQLRSFPLSFRGCRFLDEPINKRYPIYSYNHCLLECRIQMMLKLCGCILHIYKPLDHEKICHVNKFQCIKRHHKEFIRLSASTQTSSRFVNKEGLPKSPRDCGCLNNCETDVYQKDLESHLPLLRSRARIGISSFPKVRVVREIIFSPYDIILRSGGVMNLCIGTSIISLMELLIITIKLVSFKIARFIGSKIYSLLQRNKKEVPKQR